MGIHQDASLRDAFTTRCGGSLLHGRRPGGLKGKRLLIHEEGTAARRGGI